MVFSAKSVGFQFQTEAGRSYTIQARTNLLKGNWVDLTNFSGNGLFRQFTFSTTNSPAGCLRVRTQ